MPSWPRSPRQYDDLHGRAGRPEVMSDPNELRRLGQEMARLEPTVAAFRRLEETRRELAGARELRDTAEGDDDMRAMAREEIDRLEADETRLLEELKVLLLPRDPNDDRDVILEVRAGAGGDEAALFAAELLRMYTRYAQRHRFTPEVLSLNETGIDGIKEAIVQVRGDGAYSRLKFEGGVHRVQRIPATESRGRIHTSTATVVVMPEVDEVEIDDRRGTRPPDRRQALVRSGRPVGQYDRLRGAHHAPADRARRRDPGREEPAQEQGQGDVRPAVAPARPAAAGAARGGLGRAASRWSAAGDRRDKVRTYNFPQDRVTDHRIGKTVHSLPSVMDGELDDLIDALVWPIRPSGSSTLTGADGRRLTWRRRGELLRRGHRAAARPPGYRDAATGRRAAPRPCGRAWTGRRSSPTAMRRSAPMPPRATGRSSSGAPPGAGRLHPRGIKEFHGLAFAVDARALIPRPETEQLVDLAQAEVMRRLTSAAAVRRAAPIRVVDVGTGSGAVAIALARRLARRRRTTRTTWILATDISADALDLARENAVGHAVGRPIRIRRGGPPAAGRRRPVGRHRWPTCRTSGPTHGRPRRDVLRAGTGARWRRGRARGDRPTARAAARPRWRRTASPCSRSARTRATPRRPRRSVPAGLARATSSRISPGRASRSSGVRRRRATRRRSVIIRRPDRPSRRPTFPIRLIALDIDGTLVGDDLIIGQRTRRAIRAALAATSRSRS